MPAASSRPTISSPVPGSADHPRMLRPGHAVALCVLALLTIGVVMVNSAGMTIHAKEPVSFDGIILSRTTVYAGLAMIALLACSVLPVRRLAAAVGNTSGPDESEGGVDEPILSPAWMRGVVREYLRLWPAWLGVFGLLALLGSVYVPGIRSPKNGSHRWINLHVPGLESVQPSELAKWGLVLLMAWYAARWSSRMKSFWLGLLPGLAMIGVVAGFVVIEDLGTGALMAAAAAIMLIAAGARFWQLLILCPVPLAGAVLAIITNPYRMHRIESFMNPYLDPQGKGFHMIQSMVSVANGQVFGRGLGGGLQKFGYLQEDTTDFIFANICEEIGVAGAAIVLFLLGTLVWSVWGIVRRESVSMLKLVGLGIMATVGVQAVINLAVVTGLGPTKGIALPLISSGGTGWILTAAALGLVIAMDRTQHIDASRPESLPDEPRDEPDGYAMPALRAVAVTAAAATATLTEIKTSASESADPIQIVRETQAPEAIEAPAPQEEIEAVELVPTPGPALESPAAPSEPESAESMFAGLVEADVPAYLSRMEETAANASALPSEPAAKPIVEPKPQLGVIPGAPGKTGLLFDLAAEPTAPARTSDSTPVALEIIVTDAAKNWLTPTGEESGA